MSLILTEPLDQGSYWPSHRPKQFGTRTAHQMRLPEFGVDFLVFRRVLPDLHQLALRRGDVHGDPVRGSF